MTDDEDLEDIVLLAGLYWLYDTYAKPQPIVVRPPPVVELFDCNGTSCRLSNNGKYTSSDCDNKCLPIGTPKYKCSGTTCIRDDIGGMALACSDLTCAPDVSIVKRCLKTQTNEQFNLPPVTPIKWHASIVTCYWLADQSKCSPEIAPWYDWCFYYASNFTIFGFKWNRTHPVTSTFLLQNGIGRYGKNKLTDQPWVRIKIGNVSSLKVVLTYQTITAVTGSGNNQFMDMYTESLDAYGNHLHQENQISCRFWDSTMGGGTYVKTITMSGRSWKHYKLDNYFGINHLDMFITDRKKPLSTETVVMDFKYLIDYLKSIGRVNTNHYISTYNTGIEQFKSVGSGDMRVNKLDITLNGANYKLAG